MVVSASEISRQEQEKVDALELSVRQREDFMAAFTHELKTPMTAVIGYADTLRSMQCEPEQQQRAANYIFTEARRVEALSEKLLQLLGLRGQPPALEPLPEQDVTIPEPLQRTDHGVDGEEIVSVYSLAGARQYTSQAVIDAERRIVESARRTGGRRWLHTLRRAPRASSSCAG